MIKKIAFYLLLLNLSNPSYSSNFLLQEPTLITQSDVEKLPQNWDATWMSQHNAELHFEFKQKTSTMDITIPSSIYSVLSTDIQEKFILQSNATYKYASNKQMAIDGFKFETHISDRILIVAKKMNT